MIGAPFLLLRESSWIVEFLELAIHMISTGAGANSFCKHIAQQRTRRFLNSALSYNAHVSYFKERKAKGSQLFSTVETDAEEFPSFQTSSIIADTTRAWVQTSLL